LTEIEQSGCYTTDNQAFVGRVGLVYTLQIETEDGGKYVSNPVKMPDVPEVDSFYVEKDTRSFYLYDASGELFSYVKDGLAINTDISEETNLERYYRFRLRVVKLVAFHTYPSGSGSHWTVSYTNDLFDVARSLPDGNMQFVTHESAFLQEPIQEEYQDGEYLSFKQWYVTQRVYAVTGDVYEYYKSVKEQLTADNEIFAPVPSRIKSNIHCVNNNNRVIGVFEVSSFNTFYKSCYIAYGYYTSTDLSSPPYYSQMFFPPEILGNTP
jgi:hypothetical protein